MPFVYIVHFDRPYHHARHYLGWSHFPYERFAAHDAGHGSPLVRAVRRAGIGIWLALLVEGGRDLERWYKRQRSTPRYCPHCSLHGGLFGTDPVPRRKECSRVR